MPRRISAKRLSKAKKRFATLAKVEKEHILKVLMAVDWNIFHAARILRISRGKLYNRIGIYKLRKKAARSR